MCEVWEELHQLGVDLGDVVADDHLVLSAGLDDGDDTASVLDSVGGGLGLVFEGEAKAGGAVRQGADVARAPDPGQQIGRECRVVGAGHCQILLDPGPAGAETKKDLRRRALACAYVSGLAPGGSQSCGPIGPASRLVMIIFLDQAPSWCPSSHRSLSSVIRRCSPEARGRGTVRNGRRAWSGRRSRPRRPLCPALVRGAPGPRRATW